MMKLLEETVLGRSDGVPRLAARQFATFASFTEDGSSVVTLHEDYDSWRLRLDHSKRPRPYRAL